MSHCLRKSFYALVACTAASLNMGAGAAAAATLTGVGTEAPIIKNGISPAGYRSYDDGYGARDGYDSWRWDDDSAPARYNGWAPRGSTYFDDEDEAWLPPPRPSSCGQYRYWNGEWCADARRRPPYIGPRW